MDIYIIRHGRTRWNKDLRWQGCTDVELDETGRAQAGAVAERLMGCGVTTLYSSPLKRARATAEAIGACLRLQPLFRDDLREIEFGPWEGLSFVEVRERYAEQLHIWETEPETEIGMGIETFGRLRDRAVAEVRGICANHGGGDTIAIVTHGAWIRAFLLYVLNIPPERRLCFELDNAGVSIVRYNPEKDVFRVSTMNEHVHIAGGSVNLNMKKRM